MAQPDPRDSDLAPNFMRLSSAVSDRYRIEHELGAGGMATVYLAHDLRHDRKVAVKVLRPELAAVIGAQRFLAEIKTTANLQHPHILPLHDSGEVDGTVFYVMPFVDGESLRDRLTREKQLPVADAVRIASEVAAALDYAHRHGVIHRDIKPENILLHDGSALVADFGIALAVSNTGGHRMTETGMSLGTPHYMSPEQAMGERDIDARTDVYALGCVLYEMLTGEPPFTGPTAQAIVAKVMTATPEPVSTYRKTVSAVIEEAVGTALEKLPADRFASAREFAEALEGWERGTGSSARASGRVGGRGGARASERAVRWTPVLMHPLVWLMGLLALGALAFAFHEQATLHRGTPESVVRFTVDIPAGYQASLWDAQGPDLAISPDGSTLAFCVIDPQGNRQLFTRRMDADTGRVLPGTEGAYAPVFSPDGASLLYWSAGRFVKIALSGGAPQTVGDPGSVQTQSWLPGGVIVYADATHPYLLRSHESGGTPEPAARLDSARGETIQLFPRALQDGRHVLYESWGKGGIEDARIGLLDLATRRARRLDVRGVSPLGMLDGRLIYTDQAGTILAVKLDLESGAVSAQPIPLAEGVATANRGSGVAVLSPSGTLAYAVGNQFSRLVLANAEGETPLLPESRTYSFPRYSPDGRRVAVTVDAATSSDIWLADVESGNLVRLTSGGIANERPEWSPDGKQVLFRTVRGAHSAIWWQPADASGSATPLVANDTADYFEGVLTPDGRNVIYQVDTAQSNVMTQSVDGGPPHPIANSAGAESQARVSPDGKWVAFVASGEVGSQVIVVPLPGPGARVQVSVRGGSEPVWSRDGRRIFYRSDGKFMVADVSTTPTFHVTARVEFMEDRYLHSPAPHANYDVTPDGKRLLVLEGEPQRLRVAHDWSSEVRAKLGVGNPHR
jgi:serine/threonine-protein kinase